MGHRRFRRLSGLSELVSFCKDKGFVLPSSEKYGGFASSFDFGPIGTLLKRNVETRWWRKFVSMQEDVHGLDSSLLMPAKVWEQSGHLENFSDRLVDCFSCKKRFRSDHLKLGDGQKICDIGCPCGSLDRWGDQVSDERPFNLMLSSSVGPVKDAGSLAYFRPETAQGTYTNFASICNAVSPKLPFGVAQSGKAFRNEVTIGNFLFRTREFEQMELQWFCEKDVADHWFNHWLSEAKSWLKDQLGLDMQNTRVINHENDDLAHYAIRTSDIEYKFPFGWGELWGFSNRGSYDLERHEMTYRDPANPKRVFSPTVIEPALGLTRLVLAVLCDAFVVEEIINQKGERDQRTVLRISPSIAPYSVAVLTLIGKNDTQRTMARDVFLKLAEASHVNYPTIDLSTAKIGKKYRKQDEIGTPYCVTVDYESAKDNCVTLRDRDTMRQVRVSMERLLSTPISDYKKIINEKCIDY